MLGMTAITIENLFDQIRNAKRKGTRIFLMSQVLKTGYTFQRGWILLLNLRCRVSFGSGNPKERLRDRRSEENAKIPRDEGLKFGKIFQFVKQAARTQRTIL